MKSGILVKMTLQKAEFGKADPGTAAGVVAARVPRPPQHCMSTAVCHTPGQAVTQPLAPPGLGTEQGAWDHFLPKQLCL